LRHKKTLIIIIVVLIVIIVAYLYLSQNNDLKPQKPLTPKTIDSLGYKQNNPGNIRKSGDVFDGEIQSSTGFKSFYQMAYGYRAMAILLYNFYKDGDNTISKMISRYAPPNENQTANYIYDVSKATGISPDKVLAISDFKPGLFLKEPLVKKIVRAISQKEISWVNEKELTTGYNEFLKDRL
jgi:hypothetical protein